jgi:RES domain-containing protein
MAVIYAAKTYSLSLLATLVYTGFRKLPGGKHYSRIIIPDSASIESFIPAAYLGLDLDDNVVSRAFGDRWIKEKRSLVLRVPSVVTGGPKWNTVINSLHPEYPLIKPDSAQAVYWDARLVKSRLFLPLEMVPPRLPPERYAFLTLARKCQRLYALRRSRELPQSFVQRHISNSSAATLAIMGLKIWLTGETSTSGLWGACSRLRITLP